MNDLYQRLSDEGRQVLMVPKAMLTNDEKTALRAQRDLLVGQTHNHFLVSMEDDVADADVTPPLPTKPTDPNSPEALLNPANPEGQYRQPDEAVSTPELQAMTVAQLRSYADEHKIDLGDAKRKDDIVAKIREEEVDAHDAEQADKDANPDDPDADNGVVNDDPASSSEANRQRLEGERL